MTLQSRPNRSFLHPGAEVRSVRGMQGVFATLDLAAGTLVTLWGGELITLDELEAVDPERQHYFVHVERDWLIGPVTGPVEGQEFFNHSCDPTCGMSGQIGLITRRAVSAGEELTFDYAMAELAAQPWDCGCGAELCRGRVRENDALRADLRARYAGFFSPWIQRVIDGREVVG